MPMERVLLVNLQPKLGQECVEVGQQTAHGGAAHPSPRESIGSGSRHEIAIAYQTTRLPARPRGPRATPGLVTDECPTAVAGGSGPWMSDGLGAHHRPML